MKPILYGAAETAFTSNGLGRLSDCISCFVEEERNGKYELEMEYPVTGLHFEEILHSRIIYAVPADGKPKQAFRIYEITKPISGVVTVYAEHISYQLSHIPVSPFLEVQSVQTALLAIETNVAEDCPFTFETTKSSTGSMSLDEPRSVRALLGGTEGSILDRFGGGEYEWDMYTVRLHQNRGMDRGVTLRYGKNIVDLEQEESIANTITGVYPYWKGTVDDADVLVELPEKVVHSANANNFPYDRTITLDCSSHFNNQPTVAQLRTYANSYVSRAGIGVPKISLTVSFLPLWQSEEYRNVANLERVNLCDTVTVEFPKLNVSATAKVVRTKYDVLKERYEEIELGDAKTSFSAQVRGDIEDAVSTVTQRVTGVQAVIEAEIKRNSDMITGNLGGYIVTVLDADGKPTEFLIMDTDDIQTAVNVWRFNAGGLGHSHSGYAGPYNDVALTADGHINASMVSVGTLNAALIKVGLLRDVAGKNFWNMETGEFSLSANSTVGGQTVSTIANSAASSAVNGQTQQSIFNKLTNNGQTQGIYLKDGKLYLNGTYLQAGIINIKDENDVSTFYANTQTGVVHIVAKTFKLISGDTTKTIPEIAADKATAAVNGQTQQSIFNKLTNNGQTQGIYLSGGKLYINSQYIVAGRISSKSGNAYFDLDNNEIAATKICNSSGRTVLGVKSETSGISEHSVLEIYGADSTTPTGSIGEYGGNGLVIFGKQLVNLELFNMMSGCVIQLRETGWTLKAFTDSSHNRTSSMLLDNGVIEMNCIKAKYNSAEIATVSSSSIRYKHNIKPIEDKTLNPHKLLELPVVQFEWNNDHHLQYEDMKGKTVPGIIAEDVEKIYPAATIHKDGKVESWDERRLIPGMLSLIQEQDEKIKSLEARLARLEELLK